MKDESESQGEIKIIVLWSTFGGEYSIEYSIDYLLVFEKYSILTRVDYFYK